MSKDEIQNRIREIEVAMAQPDFWTDKESAQKLIQEYQDIKHELENGTGGKYDRSNAIITILAGAGGTDAEDFARMLLEMYAGFAKGKNWDVIILYDNQNDQGGFRNITFEIIGKGSFGTLQFESGVHRLVRISPFNAQQKRHTAFAMVEVIPKLADIKDFELNDDDLEIEFTKSSGPGGQNVNKRETAVRITHKPTGLSVHNSSERTQEANRQRAMDILRGRIYKKLEEDRAEREGDFRIAKTTANEWGSQIRSYVLHPYQMVKDHRTNTEIRDVESVLSGGIDPFIESIKPQ